jgi:hypothetical protein
MSAWKRWFKKKSVIGVFMISALQRSSGTSSFVGLQDDNGGMHNFLDLTPMNDVICNLTGLVIISIYQYLADIWFH